MKEPKKIYISDAGWELLDSGLSCNAYPNKNSINAPMPFVCVNHLKEWIAKNSQSELSFDEVIFNINRDELLKYLDKP